MKIRNEHPQIDCFYAVDDLKAFHKANMDKNYKDYSYLNRMTHGMPAAWFQTRGARVHFNETRGQGDKKVRFRYGIVEYADVVRDLQCWETLMTSSFMQRPHTILKIDEEISDELAEA